MLCTSSVCGVSSCQPEPWARVVLSVGKTYSSRLYCPVVKGCTEYGNDTFVHSIAPIGKVIAKVEDEGPGVIFRVLEHQGLPSQADGYLQEKELIF